MTGPRTILAVVLLLLGAMVYIGQQGVTALAGEIRGITGGMDRIADKLDTISSRIPPLQLQTATGWIGRPRFPAIRRIPRTPPTPIDALARR